MHRLITVLASALVLSAALCRTSAAITVTTTGDEDNGPPNAGCSLREAVTAINTASSYGGCTFVGGDTTVTLGANTYIVSLNPSDRIEINVPMTILGVGPAATTIQGDPGFDHDILFVDLQVDGTVSIQSLALTGATGDNNGSDAALFVIAQTNRNLVLQDVTIRDNQPTGVPAFNIQGNSSGNVGLTRVIFQNNVATAAQFGSASGAAMRCTVGNASSPPSVTMTDVSFIQNSVSNAFAFTTFAAGLNSIGCNLDLENVTFDTNTSSGPTSPALAGAMVVTDYAGSTTNVTLTNVTFFGNSGGSAGALYESILPSGGGGPAVTLTNVTFAQNTASTQGGGDHMFQDNGAGANLRNVLFGPTAGDDCAGNPSPSFTLGGGNMDSDGTCNAEQTSATPGLDAALANNGGFTETLALLPGGDAVDAGTNTGCPTTDQRGATRPQDGDGDSTATCDVGAFELVPPAPPGTVQFSSPTYSVGEGGGFATITITRTGGSAGAISVNFSTVLGGSAADGSDYTALGNIPVNFADGDTASKTIQVQIIDDPDVEGDETVNLALTGSPLGSPSTAVLTIVDNDAVSVPVSEIPAAGRWGLAILLAALAGAAVWRLRVSA